MHLRRRIGLGGPGLGRARSATAARAEWVIVPPRAGQVGLSIQGQYRQLLPGDVGDDYDNGPGLAVRLRYRMRYERAMGLSFESQRFNTQTPTVDDTLPNHTTFYMYGIDVYQMFDTRSKRDQDAGRRARVVPGAPEPERRGDPVRELRTTASTSRRSAGSSASSGRAGPST